MMIGYFTYSLVEQDLRHSRIERFEKIIREGGPKLTQELKAALADARENPKAIDRVLQELKKQTPQLDRLDVMTVENGSVRILAASQRGGGGILRSLPRFPVRNTMLRLGTLGEKSQLADLIENGKQHVSDDLSNAKPWDMRAVSRSFGSAVHQPMVWNGKKSLVNFWSRDAQAFPPRAVEFYSKVVAELERK
jgi:hypothetical protein